MNELYSERDATLKELFALFMRQQLLFPVWLLWMIIAKCVAEVKQIEGENKELLNGN